MKDVYVKKFRKGYFIQSTIYFAVAVSQKKLTLKLLLSPFGGGWGEIIKMNLVQLENIKTNILFICF